MGLNPAQFELVQGNSRPKLSPCRKRTDHSLIHGPNPAVPPPNASPPPPSPNRGGRRRPPPTEGIFLLVGFEPEPVDMAPEEGDGEGGTHGGGAAQAARGAAPGRAQPATGTVHAIPRLEAPPHRPPCRPRGAAPPGPRRPLHEGSSSVPFPFLPHLLLVLWMPEWNSRPD
jgi:hypothetical protein